MQVLAVGLIPVLVEECTLALAVGPIQDLAEECIRVPVVVRIQAPEVGFTLALVVGLIVALEVDCMPVLEEVCILDMIRIHIRQSIQRGLFLLWN